MAWENARNIVSDTKQFAWSEKQFAPYFFPFPL